MNNRTGGAYGARAAFSTDVDALGRHEPADERDLKLIAVMRAGGIVFAAREIDRIVDRAHLGRIGRVAPLERLELGRAEKDDAVRHSQQRDEEFAPETGRGLMNIAAAVNMEQHALAARLGDGDQDQVAADRFDVEGSVGMEDGSRRTPDIGGGLADEQKALGTAAKPAARLRRPEPEIGVVHRALRRRNQIGHQRGDAADIHSRVERRCRDENLDRHDVTRRPRRHVEAGSQNGRGRLQQLRKQILHEGRHGPMMFRNGRSLECPVSFIHAIRTSVPIEHDRVGVVE